MTTIDTVLIVGIVLFVNVTAIFAGVIALVEIGRRSVMNWQKTALTPESLKTILEQRDSTKDVNVVECQRMCITLKNNEGEFIGLCTEMSSKRWTFEQVVTVPETRGEAGEAVEGVLHVPPENILFHQILTEVHNAIDA